MQGAGVGWGMAAVMAMAVLVVVQGPHRTWASSCPADGTQREVDGQCAQVLGDIVITGAFPLCGTFARSLPAAFSGSSSFTTLGLGGSYEVKFNAVRAPLFYVTANGADGNGNVWRQVWEWDATGTTREHFHGEYPPPIDKVFAQKGSGLWSVRNVNWGTANANVRELTELFLMCEGYETFDATAAVATCGCRSPNTVVNGVCAPPDVCAVGACDYVSNRAVPASVSASVAGSASTGAIFTGTWLPPIFDAGKVVELRTDTAMKIKAPHVRIIFPSVTVYFTDPQASRLSVWVVERRSGIVHNYFEFGPACPSALHNPHYAEFDAAGEGDFAVIVKNPEITDAQVSFSGEVRMTWSCVDTQTFVLELGVQELN